MFAFDVSPREARPVAKSDLTGHISRAILDPVTHAVPQLRRSMNDTWGEQTRREFDELCRTS
jgi:hypothetical protein